MDLTWLPAWEIRSLIANREVSPVEVTEHFLARAEELDQVLHCYRSLDHAGAREQAKAAEDRVLRGHDLGPLHGVPMGVKEHVPVAGLPMMQGGLGGRPVTFMVPHRDAIVVRRLRDAGAVIFGTTIMPGMGLESLIGEDGNPSEDLSLHPRNPWDLARVPGSSSAGSCAAVSAGVLPFAIGTDGGGSTRLPAAWSGLVGLHPTRGRVPWGRIPGEQHVSAGWTVTLGPVTRDVRDAATVMRAIAGPDGTDVLAVQSDAPDYLADLEGGVRDMRFAWIDDYGFARAYAGPESERVLDAVRVAAERLRDLGATLEEIDERFPDWVDMMPLVHGRVSEQVMAAAVDTRVVWWESLRRIFERYDVLLTTTIQHVAFTLERWTDEWANNRQRHVSTWCAHTMPNNLLGFPALAVPCGSVDGLPVSLQLVGPPDSEPLLFRVAHAFLAAFPFDHHPPAVR